MMILTCSCLMMCDESGGADDEIDTEEDFGEDEDHNFTPPATERQAKSYLHKVLGFD